MRSPTSSPIIRSSAELNPSIREPTISPPPHILIIRRERQGREHFVSPPKEHEEGIEARPPKTEPALGELMINIPGHGGGMPVPIKGLRESRLELAHEIASSPHPLPPESSQSIVNKIESEWRPGLFLSPSQEPVSQPEEAKVKGNPEPVAKQPTSAIEPSVHVLEPIVKSSAHASPILPQQINNISLQHNNSPQTWQNPQQMINNMISQGINLQGVGVVSSPPPTSSKGSTAFTQSSNPFGDIFDSFLSGGGSTSTSRGQSNNPLGAIGSFFGSVANDVTNAVKDVGNAISGGQIVANAATSQKPSNPFGSFFGSIANDASTFVSDVTNAVKNAGNTEINMIKNVESTIGSDVTNAAKDVGSAVTGALSTAGKAVSGALSAANNAIQNAYASAYGTKPQNAGNPFQQFFNDIAEGSALVGYYATEGLGGAGEELVHIAQGKGLENFGQAVSQFNKAGGQNIARAVGDVTEVALPAIATAIVAPELLPAELIGEASSVGIGEAISKVTTGKWQSLPEVLQEANEGGVLGAIGEAGGLALESGLAKGAGALTKLLTGNEDLASQVAHLTPVWRAAGGALTNVALQLPFSQNPEQLAINAAIGGLAGGLGPGVAGKLMSKIDEIRGTGGVAELETLTSPLTGESTEAWRVTLPNGDTIHLVPRTSFGEGDIRDFVDAYEGKTTLATHVTGSRNFLEGVKNGEVTVKVQDSPPGKGWEWRDWGKFRDLYLSPGESESEGVALTAYTGLRDTEPGIPEFRVGKSSVKDVFYRFLHPFDKGGIIGTKTDAIGIEPPEELRDYILAKKAEYLAKGVEPKWVNDYVMEDLLNDKTYGPMFKDYVNYVRTYSAEHGEPVIDPEGLLGLSHERQIELAVGSKLRGTGEEYNIWVRQTPELFRNLPGPLRDILSDWSRLKYVGAEIVPGEPLNLFEDTEGREEGGERIPSKEGELREEEGEEEGGERIPNEGEEEKIPGLREEEGEEGGERIPEFEEGGLREPEDIGLQPIENPPSPIVNSPPSPNISPPPSPIINPPPSPIVNPPPSPIINPPPSPIVNPPPSPIVNPPPSPIVNPPPSPIVNPPPSPIVNPPPYPIISPPPSPIVNPPPSPIVNPPPSPIVNPPPSPIVSPPPSPIVNPTPSPIINLPPIVNPSPSDYVQLESSPPPVFSASSQSESGAPPPMGPPPMLPMVMPGGFGGGNNNQEISGMAGEVIYL